MRMVSFRDVLSQKPRLRIVIRIPLAIKPEAFGSLPRPASIFPDLYPTIPRNPAPHAFSLYRMLVNYCHLAACWVYKADFSI